MRAQVHLLSRVMEKLPQSTLDAPILGWRALKRKPFENGGPVVSSSFHFPPACRWWRERHTFTSVLQEMGVTETWVLATQLLESTAVPARVLGSLGPTNGSTPTCFNIWLFFLIVPVNGYVR